MKKLLALVLCVMLLASVIPTAAFAGYDSGDNTGSGTKTTSGAMASLYEKFYGQGEKGLPLALAKLGAAHIYKNAFDGTNALLKLLKITGADAQEIIEALKGKLEGSLAGFLDLITLPLLSPSALFALVGMQLTDVMDLIGAVVVDNTEGEVDKTIVGVHDSIDNIAVGLGEEAPFSGLS